MLYIFFEISTFDRFPVFEMALKTTQGHRQLHEPIDYKLLSIIVPQQLCACLVWFPKYIQCRYWSKSQFLYLLSMQRSRSHFARLSVARKLAQLAYKVVKVIYELGCAILNS